MNAQNALCCQRGCKDTTFFRNSNHFAAFFYDIRHLARPKTVYFQTITYKELANSNFLAIFV